MSLAVLRAGCGLEFSSRPAAARRPAAAGDPARSSAAPRRVIARDEHAGVDAGAVRRLGAVLGPVRAPLPRAAVLRNLVDAARRRARLPGPLRRLVPLQPRRARAAALPLAHGHRRQPRVRPRAARAVRREAAPGRRPRHRARRRRRHAAHGATASRAGSTASSSPRTPTRRWRCWPRRPPTSAGCWARSRSPSTRPCCTPTQRFLPRPRGVRAAWNYQLATCAPEGSHPTMTYSMNRLQRPSEDEEYCVTLNRGREIDEARVIARFDYTHPQYTFTSLAAQSELPVAERAEPHGVRRRLAGLRVPRGRAHVRRSARRRRSSA